MTRRSVPRRTILAWLLGALLVVPFMAACEATPSVKTIPTQALHFSFDITGMYANDLLFQASDPYMRMDVLVDVLSRGGSALDGGQRLTCDGQTDPAEKRPWRSLTFRLPRRAPGQAYRCVYTDERGVATELAIPVPLGTLAFISPQAGAHLLPLGAGARLPIRYTFPAPPGYVPPSVTPAGAAPSQGSPIPSPTPFLTPSPYGPSATVHIAAWCGSLGNNGCADKAGPSKPATGSYTLPGSGVAVGGPGYLFLYLQMRWPPPAGSFAGVDIQTTDSLKVQVYFTTSIN
jgi:hypothetical protein